MTDDNLDEYIDTAEYLSMGLWILIMMFGFEECVFESSSADNRYFSLKSLLKVHK